ncbi:hypothetical protein [Streptomyces bottropensis]|uniref:hypothetical protein n=1 Tax=Streptomyces bottropensis TaxID=42235 RepID=UPI0036A3C1CC
MGSPLLLQNVASTYGRELSLLHHLLDQAVQQVAKMTKGARRRPNGPAMSALARTELLGLAEDSDSVANSRLRLQESGDQWVRVGLEGSGCSPRLRMRPPKARLTDPWLFDEDTLQGPAGSLVVMWDWSKALGTVRSVSLTRVESMRRWGIRCSILEEIAINAPLMETLINPLTHAVPAGSRNEDDDLSDVVALWGEAEERQSEQEISDGRDEDERNDEGDSTVAGN